VKERKSWTQKPPKKGNGNDFSSNFNSRQVLQSNLNDVKQMRHLGLEGTLSERLYVVFKREALRRARPSLIEVNTVTTRLKETP